MQLNGSFKGIHDCLDYALASYRRSRTGGTQWRHPLSGTGRLLVTADGRGWYSFSDETGGGLPELIAGINPWQGRDMLEAILLRLFMRHSHPFLAAAQPVCDVTSNRNGQPWWRDKEPY